LRLAGAECRSGYVPVGESRLRFGAVFKGCKENSKRMQGSDNKGVQNCYGKTQGEFKIPKILQTMQTMQTMQLV
jgi:hypothetical protein